MINNLGFRSWKNDLINWIAPQSNQNLADIAGGTDIAINIKQEQFCSCFRLNKNDPNW